ncbi:MAG TPA: hypothetical protein PKJ45_13685 [Rubrivivax sp.]|nr:hypothetical protein [Rubrivivax sp.]
MKQQAWTSLVAASALLWGTAQASPVIGFSGDFVPGNWTATVGANGDPPVADATSLSITSPRPNDNDASQTDFSITVGARATISFDWLYASSDLDGNAFYDPFGILSINAFTQLTDDDGGASQGGTFSVVVGAGEVFGFRALAIDGDYGTATTRVTNFRVDFEGSEVPEPAPLLLIGAALAAIEATRRRQGRAT